TGLGALGQHRVDRGNGDVGGTNRPDIKAGEDVLPQRVEDAGDNFGDVENFAGDLADHDVCVVVLCHRCQRVAFLNACLTQDVQVNGDALDGQTGKIVRQQIKIFAVERNDRDVVSQLAQGIRQVGADLSTADNQYVHKKTPLQA